MTTHEAYKALEEELQDPHQYKIMVERLVNLGTTNQVGRTISKLFQHTLCPQVFKLYSFDGKKRNGVEKIKFKKTKLSKAMREPMLKQEGQATHKTDDESVKKAIADHLIKKANQLNEALEKQEREEANNEL